jgi:L-ribulose-5-phosphate 4-epimerase
MSETLKLDSYWEHRRMLAVICRIIADWGYIGTFGHLSIRVPNTDIVLITPGAGAEKTTARADQIFVYDIRGKLLHHPGGELIISEPAEYHIHTRVHRDKPRIHFVAHLHSPHSTLLGIVNRPIVPVFNQAFYLYRGIPTWDDPKLVVTDEQASSLSQTLDDKVACQMRGHGSVVIGETPEIGLMNVYTIEENVKFQIASQPFGGAVQFPEPLMEEVARQRQSMTVQISRILWAYFERQTLMKGIPL